MTEVKLGSLPVVAAFHMHTSSGRAIFVPRDYRPFWTDTGAFLDDDTFQLVKDRIAELLTTKKLSPMILAGWADYGVWKPPESSEDKLMGVG